MLNFHDLKILVEDSKPRIKGLGSDKSSGMNASGDGQFIKNALGKSVLPIAT